MDGTILETADIWFELLKASVKEYTGRELKYEEWRPYFGQSMQENVRRFMPGVNQEDFDNYCIEHYSEYLDKMHILDGAEEVVEFCSKMTEGMICIVTNCPGPITAQTLAAEKAARLFHAFGGRKDGNGKIIEGTLRAVHADDPILPHMRQVEVREENVESATQPAKTPEPEHDSDEDVVLVTPDMAGQVSSVEAKTREPSAPKYLTKIPPKPDPYMVLEACRKLGVKPDECIFVGDSRFDMQAAKAAGCVTVGINVDGGDIRINSIKDLLVLFKEVKN